MEITCEDVKEFCEEFFKEEREDVYTSLEKAYLEYYSIDNDTK